MPEQVRKGVLVPRLDDVAAAAGVAKSTASRVMSGEATLTIREETRQRVLDAAAKLGYRPDTRARALRLKRSYALGIVVPEIDNPAFGAIIRSAQKAAIERGYSLFISLADKDQPDTALYRRLVEGKGVDGVLVTTISDPSLVDELRRRSIKHLLVNRELEGHRGSIIVDYVEAAAQVVEHLVRLGHRRLAFISGPLRQYAGQKRLEGFKGGLLRCGLALDEELIAECNYGWAEAAEVFKRIHATCASPPSAVCAANTTIASGVIAGARSIGLEVSGDLSVISLLDSPLALMHVPAISAVQFPFEELGRRAANALIDAIENGSEMENVRLGSFDIAARNSVGIVGSAAGSAL